MRAFLHVYQWHHDIFAMDDRGDIWRIYFDDPDQPHMMKLIGNELEYTGPIYVLRAMKQAR